MLQIFIKYKLCRLFYDKAPDKCKIKWLPETWKPSVVLRVDEKGRM